MNVKKKNLLVHHVIPPSFYVNITFSLKFDTRNVLLAWNMKPILIHVTQEIHPILKYLPHHYTETRDAFYYLLTPWCRVLLEQLVKKFPTFHGTRRFITALTSVRQLSLSWASPIQSIYPHLTSCRSILILSTHLRLGLPSGLFPSGFPTKALHTPVS